MRSSALYERHQRASVTCLPPRSYPSPAIVLWVCHLGLNPKRRTGIENDVIFETTGRITAFSPAYSYFVYSPPPQFVLFEDEDVASSRHERVYLEVQATTCKATFAAEDDRVQEELVSDGEVFPRVFQNRFLLCACTATAQLRKGRGRKTRQASNATMLIDPPQISATTSRILMWSVRSFNPRPTLVSNPKRGLDARGRAP